MGHNTEWQQIDMSVTLRGIENANPYQDITVSVLQNGSEASRRTLTSAERVEGGTLVFSHLPELVFPQETNTAVSKASATVFPAWVWIH